MIKVVEHGKADYIAQCDNCGCKFSYDIREVRIGTVKCPDCYAFVRHDRALNEKPDSRSIDELYPDWKEVHPLNTFNTFFNK